MSTSSTVGEILKNKGSQVWSVAPDTTVYNALVLMADKNIGALCVTDGDRIIGIISERDYTRKIVLRGRSSRTTTVKEITSGHIISVTTESTVEECLHLMTDNRVRHLPVMADGRLTGLVSIGDLVNSIISDQQNTISQLQT